MLKWQTVFQQERYERMTKYQTMTASKNLLMQILGDETQQLEILTLLVYDSQKHGDTFTDFEYDVVAGVYETCTRLSGLNVVNVPEWFVPAYDTQQNRWQDTKVDVEHLLTQSEEFCIRQASAWWDLQHPHVMKLFGACHVGKSLVLVRESAQGVKNVGSLSSQDVLVGTAQLPTQKNPAAWVSIQVTLDKRK
ncbi:TKL protein kinase [Phytophthora megakarya]|uniref:TKL protein kinase n=1 Tax=Phytophthora megakarya TaxID=4795 RepID=A0A225WZF0_9STRA|nr:TKL protein kinase [Phytophthora megakarya]